jgi:hypothetical protein
MKISRYPLYQLTTDLTTPFEIDNGVSIVNNNIILGKRNVANLSKKDKLHIKEAKYCLSINQDIVSPGEASVLFMLSCRLLKRTKLFIRYHINHNNEVLQITDRYPYVTAWNATTQIRNEEFKKIKKIYLSLQNFQSLNRRAINATYFLLMAYRSRSWLESLIFHVCALETLTSGKKRESKITKKFVDRVHNFTGSNKQRLEKIYNIRSELVHGRYNTKDTDQHLVFNRTAESACRKMFVRILLNSHNIKAFANDSSRLKLF